MALVSGVTAEKSNVLGRGRLIRMCEGRGSTHFADHHHPTFFNSPIPFSMLEVIMFDDVHKFQFYREMLCL